MTELTQGDDKIPNYINPNLFSIKVHYGGIFVVESGRKSYVGGQVRYSDYEDRSRFSLSELDEIGKKIGFNNLVEYYYKVTGGGYKIIQTHGELSDMVNHVKDKVIQIFIVIPNSILDDLQDVNVSNWEWDCGTLPESGISIENIDMLEGLGGNLDEDDSDSDANYDHFSDSDYDLSDGDDKMFEDNVDVNTDWASSRIKPRVPSQINVTDGDGGEEYPASDDEEYPDFDDGFSSLDERDGEDELPARKPPVFKPIKGKQDPIFCEGMIFRNRAQIAGAIRHHSILQGKDIRFTKNETTRVRAKCRIYVDPEDGKKKGECPWELFASDRGKANKTLQVKKYNPNHNCGRIWNNRLMSCSWLAMIYFDDLRISPNFKVSELVEKVRQEFKCNVSQSQCYRAKHKVLKKVQGSIEGQYAMLWDYCNERKRTNPGTSVFIHLKSDLDGITSNVFQRFYICWEALKKGFRAGCRPIIGVDGCHLKGGHCLGQLLTAVGIDANDQTFPVAYAIVEQENTSSWTWFLMHLIPDLEIVNEPTWTIISDKQKGLEHAIQERLPAIEHRHCVRHLHNNFKIAGFSGQVLHDKMWNLAKASYVGKFNFLMGELEKEDPDAFAWLSHPDRDPCHWSRSHFIVTPKCDILLNNLCESFNNAILCARDKPLLTMLERLRTYFMGRLVKKREFATKWVDDLGPKIHKKIKNRYGDYIVHPCGEGEFEAVGFNSGQYTVNLRNQTCSCRRWDLTGIPCEHASRVIVESEGQPEEYVSDWYSKHNFLTTYGYIMHPMNGPDMWEKSGKAPIKPPDFTRQPGRPKKSKKKGSR